jgi:hypothetical protein
VCTTYPAFSLQLHIMGKTNNNSNMKRSKSKTYNNSRIQNNVRMDGIPNPPQWSPTQVIDFKQRFILSTAGVSALPISTTDLLNLKALATSATAAYRIFDAVKLRKVEVWAANTAATASNTILVEFLSSNPYMSDDSKMFSDTAVGTTNVAYVKAKPNPYGMSAAWFSGASNSFTIFNLTAPEGSVVDVHLTARLIDDEPKLPNAGITVAAATTGTLYGLYLDNDQGAGAVIVPVGVNTVV